jgi:hypothetical protein
VVAKWRGKESIQWSEKMNAMPLTKTRSIWSRILIVVGNIAMLVGALDPMEGSLLILPGSGLMALGTFVGQWERHAIAYRVVVFVLIAIGVGSLWGLGDLGGKSGRSMWWAMLILPYLIGWFMGIWGPKSPRWLLILCIAVGLWYLAISVMILNRPAGSHQPRALATIIMGALGLLTIGGSIIRLSKSVNEHSGLGSTVDTKRTEEGIDDL